MIRTKRKGLLAVLAVLAALLVASLAGVQPAQAAEDEPAEPKADVTVTVSKTLLSSTKTDEEGNPQQLDIPEGEFKFELYDPEGNKVGEATVNDKGFAKFELKDLTTADSGEYTVKEVQDKKSKYTYDEDKKVTITVGELETFSGVGNTNNVETGNSAAMQHYQLYDGAGEQVTYSHGTTISGDGVSFKKITDADANEYHAFCLVRNLSSSDTDAPTRNRYRGDADNGAGGTYLDKPRELNDAWDGSAPDNNSYASGLLTILWNGYPHNARGFMEQYGLSKEEFYQVTQHVIYAYGRFGGTCTDASSEPVSYNTFRTKAANQDLFDRLYNAACQAGHGWDDNRSLDVPYVEGDQVSVLYVHLYNDTMQPLVSSWIKGASEKKFQAVATSASFTNTDTPSETDEEKGNLVIKKTFTGDLPTADQNKLSITITGKDIDGEGKDTKTITFADFANGEYKVTGLPVDETYTVKETNAEGLSTDYTLVTASSTTEGTATITANADATVALKNTYEPTDSGGTTPTITNTTAKGNGQTGTVEIEESEKVSLTDTVELSNLVEGTTYSIEWEVVDTAANNKSILSGTEPGVTASPVEITLGDVDAAGTYSVKTVLKDADGKVVSTHNDAFSVASETVTVMVTQSVGDNPEIKTSATGTVKPEANQTITDTITWYNLPAGKYTAAGTLVDADGNEIASEGGSVDFEVTEADAEKGQGTVDVTFTFDASSLKAGDKIVVFERLLVDGKPYTYTATDADGNETETPVVHEDLTDVSQTVTVTTASENPKDDEPTPSGGDDEPTPSGGDDKPTPSGGDDEPTPSGGDDKPTPSGGDDTPQPEPGPEPEPVPGAIRTTVSANGVQGSAAAPIKFDTRGVVPVVDTITYTGLQAGATYAVTGTLMQVKDNVATAVPGGTVVENKTADSVNGTWTMDFGYLTMEENAYYVVYEEAVNVDDSSDAAEHKDMTDLAQAIVVGEGLEEVTIDNPPTTFTPASTPDIKTTVSAGGKTASTTAPVNLTAAEAGKISAVTDTVAYTNVPAGTYVLVGSLMSSKDNFEEPVAEGMKVVTVAEGAEESGTWAIDIEDVKLAEDTKYVVFEYLVVADSIEQVNEAVNAGTELPLVLAAHEDSNDVAQTIVVAKKPTTTAPPTTTTPATSGAKTTAKTADDMGGVALAMFALAVMAAGGVAVARRKGTE